MAASCTRRVSILGVVFAALLGLAPAATAARQNTNATLADLSRPDFVAQARQQLETDQRWFDAGPGYMRVEKITYRNPHDGLTIPAFVFQPLITRGKAQHPALVWVHENIRGHLYEHYIPFIRQATALGYVVIAPEYRGSVGYGKAFYDAIDYGGAEVDDVVQAAAVLELRYPIVNPERIGIIGWSHGGMIALLAAARAPSAFQAAAALAPVTNLFHRLARKGIEAQRRAIDPHNRFGGSPAEVPAVYRARSPLFQVDRIQIPLLVHVADNDEDVEIEESMPLIDALRARKAGLASVKVYHAPAGGHTFDRRMVPGTIQPENTPAQRDSWQRVWSFLDNYLQSSYN
jgi:dipeptidyl aminopeptidase/acylaminoacyl peptidase